MSGLDRYDPDDIDDADVGQDVTFEEAQAARLRAEADLDRRDAREGVGNRRQRLPGALEGDKEPVIALTPTCLLRSASKCPAYCLEFVHTSF